jgi:xylulokinase
VAEPWILAVDLGTGGPKTGAISLEGKVLTCSLSAVTTIYLPGGGAVQDPEEWWRQIAAGVRTTVESGSVRARDLVGVGITGQWGSTVPVDRDGNPAGPCMLWADTRGGRFSARAVGGPLSVLGYSPAGIVQWMRFTGGAPSPHGADPLGHELYMRNCDPEVYARTAVFLEPLDYLALRFTGRAVATPASMILSWLTDNRHGGKPAYVPALVRRAGRDASRLPPVVATGSVVGEVREDVAAELGIPRVPVVAGVPDLHTAYLGSGAVGPFEAHVTISTTAWISCRVPFKRTDVLHQMASVPGPLPGTYLVANNHETAGLCLKWLRDAMMPGGYDELTELAAQIPPGAGGVMFTPWLNGERTPVEDRTLRGAFLNVSLDAGRGHFVRAVLEGVAFNARWLLDAVESFVRRPIPRLRILGGGAQSDLWCQIHADVLGRPVERVDEPMYASLRGAGIFAALRLGKLDLERVAGMVPAEKRFEPDAAARTVYEPMYAEFKRFYSVLRGPYARLNGRPRTG